HRRGFRSPMTASGHLPPVAGDGPNPAGTPDELAFPGAGYRAVVVQQVENAQQLLRIEQSYDGLSEIDDPLSYRTKAKRRRMEVAGMIRPDRSQLPARVSRPSTVACGYARGQDDATRKRPLGSKGQPSSQARLTEEPPALDSLRRGSSKRSTHQSPRFGDHHHAQRVAGHGLEATGD